MTSEKLKELIELQNKIKVIDSVIAKLKGHRDSKASITDIMLFSKELLPMFEDLRIKLNEEFKDA